MLSVFSFDYSAMSGLFCLLRVSFYDSLLASTFILAAMVMTIRAASLVLRRAALRAGDTERAQRMEQFGRLVYVYVLLFAFPVSAAVAFTRCGYLSIA
jgi:hypothetical protein